jgi:hypothetical protein
MRWGYLSLPRKRFQQVHLQHILRILREYSGGSKSYRLVPAEVIAVAQNNRSCQGRHRCFVRYPDRQDSGSCRGKWQRENDRRNGDDESRFGDRRKHFVSWTGYHEPTGKRVSSVGRICALPIRSSQPSLQSAFERTELRDAARESLRSQWCSNSAWKLKNTGAGLMASN